MSIWSDIGTALVDKGLPLLGAAVGGPAGASLGGMLASVLGSETAEPEAILKQIQTAPPELIAKLKEMEFKHKEKLEEIALQRYQAELTAQTQQIESVNQTMRVEAKSGGLAGAWRPVWGFVSAAAFLILVFAISIKMFKNPADLPDILDGLAAMQWFWMIPLSVLGVASWHRGQEKRVLAGEKKGGLTQIVSAWKGRGNV